MKNFGYKPLILQSENNWIHILENFVLVW
jgi:hypothetical protein